jgi:hypothetical protein
MPHTRPARVRNSALIALAIGIAVLLVHWRALFCFFSADDAIHLEQAAGLVATPRVPWRFLTQVVYFRLMLGLFGARPLAFMTVNVLLHVVNAVLVHRLLRRYVDDAIAITATVLFAACPLLTIVLGHAVIVNDVSALTVTLVVLLSFASATTIALVAMFVVALLCKESVLFMPVVVAALVPSPRALRSPRALALAATMVATAAAFLVARAGAAAPSGTAYAMSRYAVVPNLCTYVAWFLSLWRPLPDLVRSPDPRAWRLALPFFALALFTAWRVPRARRGMLVGGTWFVAGLLPVLPLAYSTYPHYLYVALPGLALVAALLIHLLPRDAWPYLAAAICVGYPMQAARLAAERFTLRIRGTDVPLDPQIRSWVVAGRAVVSLEGRLPTGRAHLAVLGNVGRVEVLNARTGQRYASLDSSRTGYDLVRAMLDDGRALRVFYPQVDTVAYLDTWPRAPLRGWWLALPVGAGNLAIYGPTDEERQRLLDDLGRMRAFSSPYDSLRARSVVY